MKAVHFEWDFVYAPKCTHQAVAHNLPQKQYSCVTACRFINCHTLLPIFYRVAVHEYVLACFFISSTLGFIVLHCQIILYLTICWLSIDKKARPVGAKTAPGHFAKKKTFSRRSIKPPNPLPYPYGGIFLTTSWNSLPRGVELRTWGVLLEPHLTSSTRGPFLIIYS